MADAGLGLLAGVGDTVILNGTSSADPEGAALSYAWSQVGGPEVLLKGATTAQPQFTIESAGTFRFELVVNDGYGDSEADAVAVEVPERSFGGGTSGCDDSSGAGVFALGFGTYLLRRARAKK